ncbi:endonuclease 4 [Acanthamoeba polyphaga mimivirus]|uniref:Endonuclease 4 n=3 Tax=Megamimivirinae TaxID=3044648 RepID=A0A2L2DJK8_MIMIV|nr:putative endonuclease 4 [Megavirus chiliensis]AEQ33272.1 endonuclease IV [Megavirus chiliensis]AUV58553.1 endonuclease 4 [Bandra megavirus]AVG46337.1 endonuclease 4 [Acanthamoeba polyphaga mimivirus]AVG47447.1 endonuclease 4 [Acanthamoeba polyphaga mimivirus]
MGKYRIGRHINISSGFLSAPEYAESLGCTIFQIFLGAPQQVLSKARQQDELIKFSKELSKRNLKMVVHGSYTINLCHPKKSKKFEASVKSLVQDLNASSLIGSRCIGVIIHMGKNIPINNISVDEAINNYILGLRHALSQTPESTKIILETGASQGSEVASRIDGLAKIYFGLDEAERDRIFFCIDTCHIWATGYDISGSVGVKKFFREFDKKIGIENISCIHFNDSKTGLESKVDRHADLGYGEIKESGLMAVAEFAKSYNIPLIMETPLDAINVKTNREVTFAEEFRKVKKWINSSNLKK